MLKTTSKERHLENLKGFSHRSSLRSRKRGHRDLLGLGVVPVACVVHSFSR